MADGGEPGHVDPDLGHDHRGGHSADARDGGQSLGGGTKGGEAVPDLRVDLRDRLLERG